MKRLLLITALLFMGAASAHNWDDDPALYDSPDASGSCLGQFCTQTNMINVARNSLHGRYCMGFGQNRVCPIPDGSFAEGHVAMYEAPWGFYDGEFHMLFKLIRNPSPEFPDFFFIQEFHSSNECGEPDHDWASMWP